MSQYNYNCSQTDRLLIIDESCLASLVIRDLYRALLQFIILADNVDPSQRTPRLGISLLQPRGLGLIPYILFPFQPVNRTSIIKLRSSINQLVTNPPSSAVPRSSYPQDKLNLNDIVTESVTAQLHSIIAAHQDATIGCEFSLTLMTGRDRVWVERSLKLCNSLTKIKNILVRRIEVVCLSSIEDCLQETGVNMDQLRLSQVSSSLSPDSCNLITNHNKIESGLGADGAMQTYSVMTDEVSLQQYFKSWLTLENNDSVDVILRIGQLTLKCDIRDCILRTDWLPFQAPFTLTGIQQTYPINNTNKQSTIQQMQSNVAIELDSVCVLEERGVCETVLFGTPRILKPTSYWKLDWEDLEENQERFHATAHCLGERKQCLLVKQSCSSDSKGRRVPITHFIILACNESNESLLIKPVVTRELVMENEIETMLSRPVRNSALKELDNTLDSLSLYKEYNPLNYESKLYSCLEQLYDAGRNSGNVSRSTVSVRNERGLVGSVPNRKMVSKGRKRMAFIEESERNDLSTNSLDHRTQRRYPNVLSEDKNLNMNNGAVHDCKDIQRNYDM